MKTLARMEKAKSFWFILITSFIFFLLKLPSLIEPYWYGDEGIYEVLGIAIRNERLLYKEIWDNKPPLLYATYALFNSDQFLVRLASLLFGLLALFTFFLLAKKLFKIQKSIFISTGLFALLFSIPLLEGNIANAENFMLFPILLASLFVYKSYQSKNSNLLFTAGILLSIAFLFKAVAIFDFVAFFLFILISYFQKSISNFKNNLQQIKKDLTLFLLGFLIPISVIFIFFFTKGAIKEFITASFIQNVGYVGYGNTLLVRNGFLLLKLMLLGIFVFLIFLKRRYFLRSTLLIYLWIGFSLFNALFSQRPYTHYVLVLLPSFCLLLGSIFEKYGLMESVNLKKNKIFEKISVLIILLILILISLEFQLYGKNIAYYANFISFVTGKKSVSSYQTFFDRKTPRDYKIAQYLKMRLDSKDQVFVWGNNAQLYALINKLPPGRYAVSYHITSYDKGFSETKLDLDRVKPRFVILMPNVPPLPYSLFGYFLKLVIDEASIYERNI